MRTQVGICRCSGEVGGARPERGQRNARLAGKPPEGGGHEAGGLLVPRHHQFDGRLAQGIDEVQVLLACKAEPVVRCSLASSCVHTVGSLAACSLDTWSCKSYGGDAACKFQSASTQYVSGRW